MTESDQHAIAMIRYWVWSGFYTPNEMREMLVDILEDDSDTAMLREAIAREDAEKRNEARGWPAATDCDRLDLIFYRLHEAGICALHNSGYTMSDGYSDVAEVCAQAPEGHYHGFCFYHGQDVERAVDGHGLMIAFGDLQDRAEQGLAIGRTVAQALGNSGFTVEWSGSVDDRISLPAIDWKRRGPPNIHEPAADPAPSSPPATAVASPAPAAAAKWWQFWRR